MNNSRMKYFMFALLVLTIAAISISCSKQDADPATEPVATTETESETETKPTPANPQSSWRTYTNSQIGYSLKYPSNWVVDTNRDRSLESREVSINSPGTSNFGQVVIGMETGSFEALRTSYVSEYKATETLGSFAGYPSYRFTFEGGVDGPNNASQKIYVPKGDVAVYVRLGSYEIETTNQIVSTFKFQ